MARRLRLVRLLDELARQRPGVEHPDRLILAGLVRVDGRIVTNPRSLVRRGSPLRVTEPVELRGSTKLRAALAHFPVRVPGRTALDLGAAAGGFTRVLLEAGARRVYAVDAGHGQLVGELRQDPRVVNLERTNLAALDSRLVPHAVGLVTVDLSYLSLAEALPQLAGLRFAAGAELVALVKPQFELGLSATPVEPAVLERARGHATAGIERAGWQVLDTMESPVRGARGATEFFAWARHAAWPGRPGQRAGGHGPAWCRGRTEAHRTRVSRSWPRQRARRARHPA